MSLPLSTCYFEEPQSDMSDVWVDNTGPRLLAAFPCEDAAVSIGVGDGRPSFQRVFFDLYADRFPAAFDRLNVACIWMGEGKAQTGARLNGPDGVILAEATIDYEGQPPPATMVQVIHFTTEHVLVLPRPGKYTVDVLLDGVPVVSFPLHVITPEVSDGQS